MSVGAEMSTQGDVKVQELIFIRTCDLYVQQTLLSSAYKIHRRYLKEHHLNN